MISLPQGSSAFTVGFVKGGIMTVASEIGDKTFFIAALLATKHSHIAVFAGAAGALFVMTILSVLFGWAAPNLIPEIYTHYAAIALFFFFGLKNIWDFINYKPEDELAEAEEEIAASDAKKKQTSKGVAVLSAVLSPAFIKAFSLTFLGEWGDRSQIATIGLAASEDPYGVGLGGFLGHALCTGAAVMGGRHLAAHINERLVLLAGGLLFIAFGVHSLLTPPS